jgi:hypothetical protein
MRASHKFLNFTWSFLIITSSFVSESFGSDIFEFVPIKTDIIESNFLNIETRTYNSPSLGFPAVIATNNNNLFIAKRESNNITHLIKAEEKLIYLKDYKIPKEPESKIHILDIEKYKNSLLITVVEQFDEIKKCSKMKLYELSSNEIFTSRFESKPCVGGVGAWNEIAGRIAVDEKNNLAFVTGGNILTDLYKNQFPRPGLCCITGTFESNMKNTNIFGSVVSINLKTNKSSKISAGHRGPQGIEFDETKNIIYETEHGPRGGDELNIIKNNKDYGWPFVTLGREYFSEFTTEDSGFGKAVKTNTHKGYTEPLFSWVPSIAPSQLHLVRKNNDFFKYWGNNLLISTLKDKSIRRLRLSENGSRVIYDERIYIGERIRDIEQLDKGFIVSTDSGLLINLSVSSSSIGGGPFPSTNN